MNLVLIAEDDVKIAGVLRDYFANAGFNVEVEPLGTKVETTVHQLQPQLLLLDLQLPGKDGMQICKSLRQNGWHQAIIIVTARIEEIDRLLGLEAGADDYICKPFSPREVVARAKTVLRRIHFTDNTNRLKLGPLVIDKHSYSATLAGHPLVLTRTEFELLNALVEQPRRVWSRAQLLERIRGTCYEAYERNIDGHIKNLRRKLAQESNAEPVIRSVYGVGYGFNYDVFGGD